MVRAARIATATVMIASAAAAGCGAEDEAGGVEFTAAEWTKVSALGPLPVLPPDPTNKYGDSADAARLGQRLFFERSYSGPIEVDGPSGAVGAAGKVGCVSCHDTGHYWVDTRTPANVSHGVNWTARNSPSLVNAAFYKWFSWAGKQDSLWMQGANGNESVDNFHGTRLHYAHVIFDKYRQDYDSLFPIPLDPALAATAPDSTRFPPAGKPKATADAPDGAWETMAAPDRQIVDVILANCGKALAAYERRLISRSSAFEMFLATKTGLSPAAKRGLRLFVGAAACDACHKGPTLTDDDFHTTGVPQMVGEHVPAMDGGRFDDIGKLVTNTFNGAGAFSDDPVAGMIKLAPVEATKTDESWKGKFRTKSLVQVGETAPYMHNGSMATLEEVVHFYNLGGGASGSYAGVKDPRIVPLHLSDAEEKDLVAFLKSLTGQPPPAELGVDTAAK
jgi:cytochrome c peroxidase